MPLRQVYVIDPVTGISHHTYQDLGPGAAKPLHGRNPSSNKLNAVGPGKFVAGKHPGISSTRKATP